MKSAEFRTPPLGSSRFKHILGDGRRFTDYAGRVRTKRGIGITKLLLITGWRPSGSRFPNGESPIGDRKPMPLLTSPFSVGPKLPWRPPSPAESRKSPARSWAGTGPAPTGAGPAPAGGSLSIIYNGNDDNGNGNGNGNGHGNGNVKGNGSGNGNDPGNSTSPDSGRCARTAACVLRWGVASSALTALPDLARGVGFWRRAVVRAPPGETPWYI